MPALEVVCAVAVKGDKVFLAKRKQGGPHGGLWEFPGGKIELGEGPEAALKREIQEEHGTPITILEKGLPVTDGRIELLPFRIHFQGIPECLDAEDIGWFLFTDAEKLMMPPCDRRILLRLIQRETRYTASHPPTKPKLENPS